MRIQTTINARTAHRPFAKYLKNGNGRSRATCLTVMDRDVPTFSLKVSGNGTRKYCAHVQRNHRTEDIVLGTTEEITADEARRKALDAIGNAGGELNAGPLFENFAADFLKHQERRWKPATRKYNRYMVKNHLLPWFGHLRTAEITRADVKRWFDSLSGTPGNANRTLPLLSAMMRHAELRDIRPQGSNPCRKMKRYRMTPRERFLSAEELKRLGTVLNHAEAESYSGG